MVLFDDVIEILDSPQFAVDGQDFIFHRCGERLRIRRVLIGADGERKSPVISPHQLLEEPFCRGNFAPGAEHELDCLAGGIYCAVQVFPLGADLDVSLVEAV